MRKRMEKCWKPLVIVLLLSAAVLAISPKPIKVKAQELTTFQVDPQAVTGNPDDIFTVEVNVYDADDLWGWQVFMFWDETVLEYQSFSFAGFLAKQPENSTTAGPTLYPATAPYYGFMAAETTFGTYAGRTVAFGTLCEVTFKILALVETNITISGEYTFWQDSSLNVYGDQPGEMIQNDGKYIPPWPEDINQDGLVDVLDLAWVAINWGKTDPDINPPEADIVDDGVIDIFDLTAVALKYGQYAGY